MDWQSLGIVSGSALLGVAGLQAIGAIYAIRKQLRRSRERCTTRQQTFDSQLATELQWARAAKPVLKAWPETRPFKVAAVVDEAIDCKSFYLVPEDGRPLPRFEPGQFLTFHLPVDPRQKPLVRCYSLSERPREDYYRVTIKRARRPNSQPQAPDGVASSYFHERVRVGTTLQVQAPQGAFFLDPTEKSPIVLIGAGIGITPILSIMNTLRHERTDQQAYVFAGFGNSAEHPFRQHIDEVESSSENISVDTSYSRPSADDQLGHDFDHHGYVNVERLRLQLPSNNFRFYLCGPGGMMETLVPALREWGVPDSHIHFEAFGPASVKSVNVTRTLEDIAKGPCHVEFLLAEASLAWDNGDDSLLEFAERQGVPLEYGCRAGNCGQCLVSVKQGTVEHVKEPGMPLEANQCLTCIGVPRGDVVLEA
ncbi:MAG: 2Fe-2S iron-sulfur cluster-binding protein [Planctomycetota bacterium]